MFYFMTFTHKFACFFLAVYVLGYENCLVGFSGEQSLKSVVLFELLHYCQGHYIGVLLVGGLYCETNHRCL